MKPEIKYTVTVKVSSYYKLFFDFTDINEAISLVTALMGNIDREASDPFYIDIVPMLVEEKTEEAQGDE